MAKESPSSGLILVGAGKMGGALLSGWLKNSASRSLEISVLEPAPSTELKELVSAYDLELNPSIDELAKRKFETVVLAVKPQVVTAVLSTLKPLVHPNVLFVSIAAGKAIASIQNDLGVAVSVVRAMPNLPASIGKGITALYAASGVSQNHRDLGARLMEAVGDVVFLDDEPQMDAVTAISGSGPAYVFYLIECLIVAAEDAGLPPHLAVQFARATVFGAAELARVSKEDAAVLRESVTSKGGTTAAALKILMEENGLESLLRRTVRAAIDRAKEFESRA